LAKADFYLGSPTSTVVPYLGGQFGISTYTYESGDYDSSSSTTAYGVHGGFKFFPIENVSWNLEADYTQYKPEVKEKEEEYTINYLSILLGFSYYF
jgi:hypothetical protein